MRGYTRLVRASVRHRWLTLIFGAMIFAASLWSTRLLPSGFIPADDVGRVLLAVELPPGSRLDDTDRVTRAISDKLRAMPEVRSALIFGGQILGAGAEPRKATFVINFIHKSEREATQKDLQLKIGAMLADQPDIRFWFLKDNGQRDLSLIVAGPDIGVINDTANQIASEMRSIPIIENPMSTAELDRPELRIEPKRQVAADLGVSTEALSETIRVATLGDIDANLAKFNAGDRLVPIRVELDQAARAHVGLLKELRVATGGGATTPLSVVADFSISHGPTAINRYDRSRRVTIEGDLRGDSALGDAVQAIHALPTARRLPPGVEIRETGDVEVMSEVFASFAAAMGAGLMMVYGLLVLLFGSFLQPITILISLPLSIGGAIIALLHHAQGDVDAGGDRHPDADGDRDQERDHAGRLRGRGDRPRHAAHAGAGRGGPQARASDRDDHDRDGGGNVPLRARPWRRRRLPFADGDRRDRRPHHVDAAVAGVRAGGVHGDGRSGPGDVAPVQPLRRRGGRTGRLGTCAAPGDAESAARQGRVGGGGIGRATSGHPGPRGQGRVSGARLAPTSAGVGGCGGRVSISAARNLNAGSNTSPMTLCGSCRWSEAP